MKKAKKKVIKKVKAVKKPAPQGEARQRRPTAVVVRPALPEKPAKAKPLYKMPAVELKFFRQLLEEKKKDLMHEVEKRLQEGQATQRVEVMDAADQALDSYESELHYGINDAERKFLDDVEEALLRVQEGLFGTCAQCGSVISKQRLKAMPSARLCITCKQAQEKTRV